MVSHEIVRAKREMAERARRLARQVSLETDRANLLKHAEELEAEANEIERRGRDQGDQH